MEALIAGQTDTFLRRHRACRDDEHWVGSCLLATVEGDVEGPGRVSHDNQFRAPTIGPIEHVEVEAAGIRIGLTSARVANALADLGVGPASSPSTELVLWCEDTDVFYDRAIAAGATSVVAPMDSPDGRLRYAWVRDPDGHQVKFVQKR